MEIAAVLMVLSIPAIVTVIEIARCFNPSFRRFLESEGWDV